MPTTVPEFEVALGLLQAADGRVLVASRDAERHQGGGLEFPGGKLEPGEDPRRGLVRELEEELGIHAVDPDPFMRISHAYADRRVVLSAYRITDWRGEPEGRQGQNLKWCTVDALDCASFPAANRPLIAALQLPPLMVVTPAPETDDPQPVLERVKRVCSGSPAMVQVRAASLSGHSRRALLAGLAGIADETVGTRLLLNGTPDEVAELPANIGLHMSARVSAMYTERPIDRGRLLSCALHDAEEARHAERLCADIAVAGPVRPTLTHPGHPGIGWEGLAGLAAATTLPLYAIGGLSPGDLSEARWHGATGVAGIRGFS